MNSTLPSQPKFQFMCHKNSSETDLYKMTLSSPPFQLVPLRARQLSFSSCQWNLIKIFQIEDMIALITKMDLIFS